MKQAGAPLVHFWFTMAHCLHGKHEGRRSAEAVRELEVHDV